MEGGRKSKRIKAKQQVAATTSLLTSAASKLSAITDNGTNEDSNDSFELDISSRGRLRKRRIIPNNTEDTGLRKRKLVDLVLGNPTSSAGADPVISSSGVSVSASPLSTSTSSASQPTVIQRQLGKSWPSHILSMLTSGGLAASPAVRAQINGQLVTTKAGSSTGLQQHLLAGQVFRLVTPGTDGTVRALHVSSTVAGGKSLHPTPGSVIISPQNLASIRFVSSTGVMTLPRERILSAGSSSSCTTSSSSTPAQASHPVIQQLLLNKSARGHTSPSKLTFAPTVSGNGSVANQSLQQQQQQGLSGVTLASSTSTITLHHPGSTPNRLSVVKPPMVMVTPQSTAKLGGGAANVSGVSATPVVVSQVSSTVSGGKQVLDLGSLSVTQIQQLMRNQAIQINMGGAGSGPTTLLLTTGLQQLGSSASTTTASMGNSTLTSAGLSGARLPPQQVQQTVRPASVVTGASSLLAMINSKGQKLMTLPASSSINSSILTTTVPSSHLSSGQQGVSAHFVENQLTIKGAASTAQVPDNSALKSVLSSRSALPQSVLTGKILSSTVSNGTAAGPGSTLITAITNTSYGQPAKGTLPTPQIISSLSASATAAAATTLVTAAVPSHPKGTAVSGSAVGKESLQQKSRTIITVPLVHLSSPGKKYASNVTVKTLLENRTPKKTEADDSSKSVPVSVEAPGGIAQNSSLVSRSQEAPLGSQCKENEIPLKGSASSLPLQSSSHSGVTSLTMPLSISTGGLECTSSEVIVPTVHIKVPSPNTLPSVLHNKNGTTIVQSTKVPIAMASEAKASETASPISDSSLVAGHGSLVQAASSKGSNVLPVSSASLSMSSVVRASSVAGPMSGASVQPTQQQGVKNVMLKVTPQSGGSGQFVQGFMTSRGLVIPQSALVQQQQGKNVILANVAQNGTVGNSGQVGGQQAQQAQGFANLPVQQTGLNILGQSAATVLPRQQTPNLNQRQQQPLQVLGATQNSSSALTFPNQVQKGTVISSGGLKFMLVNPVGQAASALTAGQQATSIASNLATPQVLTAAPQQPQTSTPAAELVKQIAANSMQVQSSSQAGGLLTPPGNSGLSPRLVQKSNIVMRAQPGMVRMSSPSAASSTTSPRAVQQTGQAILSSTVSPNMSPQLAAQILALQQQQQQQQQQQHQPGIVLAGGKQTAVGQQLQQQSQAGAPSVVTLQLQQLGQLFSSLTQLQPGGVQQQQQQQSVVPGLTGAQQPGQRQVVQLSLNPGQSYVSGANNPPQLVKVGGGQVSPQIQLASAPLQSSQGAGLVLQQPQAAQLASQNLLLQQKPTAGQPSVVSGNIGLQQQSNTLQPLLNQPQQTSIIKLPQQATTIPMKPQLSVAAPLSSSQQALQVLQNQASDANTNSMSTSSTPVSLPPSQGFVVSPAAASAAPLSGSQQQQQQVQFILNQSLPVVTGISTGVSPLSTLNKLPGGNIRRVIRADPSLLQTGLTTSAPSLAQVANLASPAVVIGGSNNGQLQGNKHGLTQMLLPTSAAGTGQILISPMKLGASPQANLISPLKLLGGLQVASSAAASSGQNTQILMNSNQLPGTILGKPSVIYAGQPAQVQGMAEKSDTSKMAQILLSQTNGNLLQGNKAVNISGTPVNTNQQQQLVIKPAAQVLQNSAAQVKTLPANVSGLANAAGAKTTYLYKVGEQYFSSAGPVAVSGSQLAPITSSLNSMTSGSALLPSPLPTSKPDVQLLVPPACIEASEKMLLQSNRNVNAPSGPGVKLHQAPTSITDSSLNVPTASNSGAVNGANFSFSLTGPTSVGSPPGASSIQASNGQTKVTAVAPVLMRAEGTGKVQLKQQSGIPTSGGDAASVSAANQQQQVVYAAATGDEEEAAMNLLTLANQAV